MNNCLLNFAYIFLLIWPICSLVSAMKECFLFLSISISILLRFYILSYGFLAFVTTRFYIFYFFFQIFHNS